MTKFKLPTPRRPSLTPIRHAGSASYPLRALLLGLVILSPGCRPAAESVVVYAAQDRVFAEPVFRKFAGTTGIDVRPVFDSEATKTTGLANRLAAEARRPQADLWWSNEEMRTRQLVRRDVLEHGWTTFGQRRRVLVVNTNRLGDLPANPALGSLTNAAFRGRFAMAHPVFGTTAAHFLVLRQRWGAEAWEAWCRALAANRPLVVDGNATVVRLVGRGDVPFGLTDSDDVAFARREGLPVAAVSLRAGEGLAVPNTVAIVKGAPRPALARRLAAHIASPTVLAELQAAGGLDADVDAAGAGAVADGLTEAAWNALLDELDPALRWLEETFVR